MRLGTNLALSKVTKMTWRWSREQQGLTQLTWPARKLQRVKSVLTQCLGMDCIGLVSMPL